MSATEKIKGRDREEDELLDRKGSSGRDMKRNREKTKETEGKRQDIDLGRERGKQRKRQRNRKETQG